MELPFLRLAFWIQVLLRYIRHIKLTNKLRISSHKLDNINIHKANRQQQKYLDMMRNWMDGQQNRLTTTTTMMMIPGKYNSAARFSLYLLPWTTAELNRTENVFIEYYMKWKEVTIRDITYIQSIPNPPSKYRLTI